MRVIGPAARAAAAFFRDRVGIVQPMKIRDFRLLWTGMFVSMVGDGFYLAAMSIQVFAISEGPGALALVGVAWSAPQVVVAPLAGVLADRMDRRRLLIAADVIRAVAIGTVGVLSVLGVLTIPLLLALVLVFGTGQALFHPAFHAIVPDVVPADLLVRANSVDQFVRPFAWMVVGPLLGAQVVHRLGVGWAFIADAGTFVWSAWMIVRIRARPARASEAHDPVLHAALEGLRFVRRTRWLLITMTASILSLFAVWGPWEALMPFVVVEDIGGDPQDLSLVYGSGGVGAVLVAIVTSQRGRLPKRPMTAVYIAWAIGMGGTALFGIVHAVWQAMIAAFITEGAIAALVVYWYTILQRLVPPRLLGRVSSLDWMITLAGVPLSFAAVGPLAATIGARATLVLAGVVGGAVTLLFLFIPGARDPERDGSLTRVEGDEEPEVVTDRSPVLP